MAKNLRERLKGENININEFVQELDINIQPFEQLGFFPKSHIQKIKNFRNEIKDDKEITDKKVDSTISKLMGFNEGVSFVGRTISIIKDQRNEILKENDIIAQAGMARTFNELSGYGIGGKKMKESAEEIMKKTRLDGSKSILEEIPTGSDKKPEIDKVIKYGEKHSGVRGEGKKTLLSLLKEAEERKSDSRIAKVTYEQLDTGRGLSKTEKDSFKGSVKHKEPDSPPAGTVLKSWVEGYKKEQLEQQAAKQR